MRFSFLSALSHLPCLANTLPPRASDPHSNTAFSSVKEVISNAHTHDTITCRCSSSSYFKQYSHFNIYTGGRRQGGRIREERKKVNACGARILRQLRVFPIEQRFATRYSRAIYGNTHRNNTLFAVEIALRWKMFEKMMFASFSFPFRDKKKFRDFVF